ncbi:hypothetical protein O181_005984 [Austropuccinia psidii MF-1]|uniref:Uncharacterized protein n=1 Tax=Austropuccinia psidii MF-1 TaxID=1389203 RepID=A0A9Q3GGE7_9BASI|nr:hypothetical protein [Austropuccinia psidii MF-1]
MGPLKTRFFLFFSIDNHMSNDIGRYSTRSHNKSEVAHTPLNEEKTMSESNKDADIAIDRGINMLKPEHILRIDGSNFQAWEQRLRLIFDTYLQNPLYLQQSDICDNKHERFCRAILLSSVPDPIQDSIITMRPCHVMYTWLRNHYFVMTRTSQCIAFNKLMTIELRENEAPSSLVLRLNEALMELKNRSGQLEEDHIMGQLVQRAVIRRPEVYRAMMDKLDTEILCGRSPTFASCVLTLESCFQRPEINDVTPSFNSMSLQQRPLPVTEGDEHSAMRSVFQITCHNCNKRGHMAKDCPESKLRRTTTSTPLPNIKPAIAPATFQAHYPIITPPTDPPFHNSHQTSHNKQHTGSQLTKQPDFYRPRYQERPIPAMKARIVEIGSSNEPEHEISVEDVTNPGDRQSVYDTGASHSLTGDLSALCRYRKLTRPIPLSVATDTAQRSFVTGVGSLIYPGYNGQHVIINGVFYSPHASGTLISPAALINSGSKIDHIGDDVLIHGNCGEPLLRANYNKTGRKWLLPLFSRLLARAIDKVDFKPPHPTSPCIEGISLIDAPDSFSAMTAETGYADQNIISFNTDHQSVKAELMKWHCLFGHIGLRRIRKLLGKSAPACLTGKQEIRDCEACLRAKSLRRSSLSPNERSVIPLNLVVADLMGPFDIATIHGGRYALNIREVASTYGECHILTNKSDASTRLKEVILRWQRLSGKLLKTLQTDNGGEFNSTDFKRWLSHEGIHHERSMPFFHQQNGIAERYNRTVADMGRTILLGSGLPKSFWGHAFMWAAYTNNILPNTHTGDSTPIEILFGSKRNLDRLRTFGEVAFVHIPQEKRQKLSERAIKAKVVMHLPDGKGWLFYNEENRQFLSSAWAKFPGSEILTNQLSKFYAGPKKGDVEFLLNTLKLGDFRNEDLIDTQNNLVEKLSHPTHLTISLTPKTYKQAVNCADKAGWINAIDNELSNMKKHDVFEVLPIPDGVKPIGGGWVFVKKPCVGTKPVRFKACYVARGNSQLSGLDFHETFAPTATFASLRILLTLAAKSKLITASFDFTAAYLNAYIDEEVWIRPPDGLVIPAGSGCKLRKALYGTRQAGRCWWNHLKNSLSSRTFIPSNYDSSVYINTDKGLTVWLHVDDGIVFGRTQSDVDNLRDSLCEEFNIKWSHGLKHIVGIDIDQTETGFCLSQPSLIQTIVNKYWDGHHTPHTPLPPKHNLVSSTETDDIIRQAEFIAAIGALSYVATGTRPDIAFAVNLLARHSKHPGKDHWLCLQYLLGYLNNTISKRLSLIPNVDATNLKVYSDASWGGEFSRSTHGYLTQFFGCTISWCSKRLSTVASSSCHAEFMALGIAARHGQWVQNLLQEITDDALILNLRCDNASCMRIANDCMSNKRTRHSDREFFITNQLLHSGVATLAWVRSTEMLADVFTKALGPQQHSVFTKRLLS